MCHRPNCVADRHSLTALGITICDEVTHKQVTYWSCGHGDGQHLVLIRFYVRFATPPLHAYQA